VIELSHAEDFNNNRNENSNFEEFIRSKEYIIYKDLKEKGFYVTSGFKYGANFLVYRDDPNFIHSEFMLFIYDSNKELNVNKLINGERLGVTTKKKFLTAGYDETTGKIKYLNFNWLNIK
jgi:tRNA-intron lyase